VASGITRVVYIEPYAKSKAAELHDDSIHLGFDRKDRAVSFEPFVGVGPRRFFDLFSMRLGSGRPLKRKREGKVLAWNLRNASLRLQMIPHSYLDLELIASEMFYTLLQARRR
jgi:cytidine deaminase